MEPIRQAGYEPDIALVLSDESAIRVTKPPGKDGRHDLAQPLFSSFGQVVDYLQHPGKEQQQRQQQRQQQQQQQQQNWDQYSGRKVYRHFFENDIDPYNVITTAQPFEPIAHPVVPPAYMARLVSYGEGLNLTARGENNVRMLAGWRPCYQIMVKMQHEQQQQQKHNIGMRGTSSSSSVDDQEDNDGYAFAVRMRDDHYHKNPLNVTAILEEGQHYQQQIRQDEQYPKDNDGGLVIVPHCKVHDGINDRIAFILPSLTTPQNHTNQANDFEHLHDPLARAVYAATVAPFMELYLHDLHPAMRNSESHAFHAMIYNGMSVVHSLQMLGMNKRGSKESCPQQKDTPETRGKTKIDYPFTEEKGRFHRIFDPPSE